MAEPSTSVIKIQRDGKEICLDFNADIKAQSFNLGWDDFHRGINDNPFEDGTFEHYHYQVGRNWAFWAGMPLGEYDGETDDE